MSVFVFVLGASASSISRPADAQDKGLEASQDLFIKKCVSCHSIGAGDRVGPDLKDVHLRRRPDWLAKMIERPSELLATDSDARALLNAYKNVKMPDLGLSSEQVQGLIELIGKCSKETCALQPKLIPVTQATAENIEAGRRLFTGETAQANGGPACISCHTVQGTGNIMAGGTLAKDLTHVFARFGDEALSAALQSPSFALMNKVYDEKPLGEDEEFALRAFFYAANRATAGGLGGQDAHPFGVPLAAGLVAIAALLVVNAAWSRRLRGVRKPMIAKKESSS